MSGLKKFVLDKLISIVIGEVMVIGMVCHVVCRTVFLLSVLTQ